VFELFAFFPSIRSSPNVLRTTISIQHNVPSYTLNTPTGLDRGAAPPLVLVVPTLMPPLTSIPLRDPRRFTSCILARDAGCVVLERHTQLARNDALLEVYLRAYIRTRVSLNRPLKMCNPRLLFFSRTHDVGMFAGE
jgi:hypothetical protein